jgi:aminomethyltransferase
MGQLRFEGKDTAEFLEYITVVDTQALDIGKASLSLITNEKGGIKDDTIITKVANDKFFVVVNGACKDADFDHM